MNMYIFENQSSVDSCVASIREELPDAGWLQIHVLPNGKRIMKFDKESLNEAEYTFMGSYTGITLEEVQSLEYVLPWFATEEESE